MRSGELLAGAALAGVAALLGLIALAARQGYTPAFFVPDAGGTRFRQFVLWSAIAMFLSTAGLLKSISRRPLSAFLYWYTIALGLIAVGLLGIMIDAVHAGPLTWTGLTAQYLSGIYMLIAAIASVRESGAWQLSLEEALCESETRYRTIFETMTEGFAIDEILLDEAGKPYDLRYLAVNPAFERQTGLKAADIIGRTTLELFPEAEPYWFDRYGKVALTGEFANFEALVRTP